MPIDSAVVLAIGSSGDTTWVQCDSLGNFCLLDLPGGDDYILRPTKTGETRWSVSGLDMLILLQFLTLPGMDLQPCQAAAGCVGHQYLTTSILDYVFGLFRPPETPVGRWQFIPASFPLDIGNHCGGFGEPPPDSLFISNLTADLVDQDFIGMVEGDVTSSWDTTFPEPTTFFSLTYEQPAADSLAVHVHIDSTEPMPTFVTAELFLTYDSSMLVFADADFTTGLLSTMPGNGYRIPVSGQLSVISMGDTVSGFGHAFSLYFTNQTKVSHTLLSAPVFICSTRVEEESFVFYSCCDEDGIRGDADNDCTFGCVNVADLSYLVAYLFQSGPAPVCEDEADADSDCTFGCVNVADLSYLVAFLFESGPAPGPCP